MGVVTLQSLLWQGDPTNNSNNTNGDSSTKEAPRELQYHVALSRHQLFPPPPPPPLAFPRSDRKKMRKTQHTT